MTNDPPPTHPSLDLGQFGWCYVPAHWARHVFFNETVGGRRIQSFGTARDVNGSYMCCLPYDGTTNYRLWCWVSCRYDYVSAGYQAPGWY